MPKRPVDRADRFGWGPGELGYTQCIDCRHRRATTGQTCAAFPDGIREAILSNEHDHRRPYPGDHGVLFEADDEEDADA
jgi:hypothetical protein